MNINKFALRIFALGVVTKVIYVFFVCVHRYLTFKNQ